MGFREEQSSICPDVVFSKKKRQRKAMTIHQVTVSLRCSKAYYTLFRTSGIGH
jgi:hypothetical protein